MLNRLVWVFTGYITRKAVFLMTTNHICFQGEAQRANHICCYICCISDNQSHLFSGWEAKHVCFYMCSILDNQSIIPSSSRVEARRASHVCYYMYFRQTITSVVLSNFRVGARRANHSVTCVVSQRRPVTSILTSIFRVEARRASHVCPVHKRTQNHLKVSR